jgi:predicted nuclease of predicted toxin-antitoxin system
VRLPIDANLSPRVAAALSKVGLESVHVGDVGLLTAPDRGILNYAGANALVIVSADSDFGELLAAARGATRPSVVLLRSADRLTSDQQAALLAALPASAGRRPGSRRDRHHRAGRTRIRSLPIVPVG